jgi:hypothetical protein
MIKPARIILFRILGFVSFLILLAVANILIPIINQDLYTKILIFLNANVMFLFILTCAGMINELFWSFNFPFNIPAPITGGALAVCTLMFFYQVWIFIKGYLNLAFDVPIASFYVLIFLLVAVIGYIVILVRQEKPKEHIKEKLERGYKSKKIGWEDVEKEFRNVLYNIGRELNKLFKPKRKRKR